MKGKKKDWSDIDKQRLITDFVKKKRVVEK